MEVHSIPEHIREKAKEVGTIRDKHGKSKSMNPKNWHYDSEQAHIIGALGECMFEYVYPDYGIDIIPEKVSNSIDFTIDEVFYDLKTHIYHKLPPDYWINYVDAKHAINYTDKKGIIATGINNIPSKATRFYLFGKILFSRLIHCPIKRMRNPRKNAYVVEFNQFTPISQTTNLMRFLR